MKLDLILENIRNKYTLGLLEESTTVGLDEKSVLQGKIMINEATQSLRGILIEEGVMVGIKNVLSNDFANIIEEAAYPGLGVRGSAPRQALADKIIANREKLANVRQERDMFKKPLTPQTHDYFANQETGVKNAINYDRLSERIKGEHNQYSDKLSERIKGYVPNKMYQLNLNNAIVQATTGESGLMFKSKNDALRNLTPKQSTPSTYHDSNTKVNILNPDGTLSDIYYKQ